MRHLLRATILVLGLVGAAPAAPKGTLGVPLPKGASQLGPSLYRSPLGFSGTVQWIERQLGKKGLRVKFSPLVDLPEVVASHAESPNASTRWSGINVSRYGGSVKVFIIERR